ncbi:MAG: YjiH family protein [Oscillospiraceae bacterium]
MKILKDKHFYRFLAFSLIGTFLFITPIWDGEGLTIPVAVASQFLVGLLGSRSSLVIYLLISLSGFLTLLNRIFKFSFFESSVFLKNLFDLRGFWFWVRIVGFAFATLIFFKVGPQIIIGDTTGGFLTCDLMPILVCVFLLSGLLLPLLLNYGLLDFVGVLLVKIMRPVFKLPGASALDCAASWLGDGSIGVLMTVRQYEQGYYSKREAAVIATNFSAVSVTFCLVVISQVGLAHMFVPFYFTVALAGLAAAIIVPKLPPLSQLPHIYYTEIPLKEEVPIGMSPFRYGIYRAVERAKHAPDLKGFLKEGFQNVLDMYFGILPVVLTFGTVALILAQYTPIFKILGLPFIPVYKLLQVPQATLASQTVMVGFADMFLPSVLASTIQSPLTRFVVAATSVTQLIYMSEIGSIIMGSKLALSLPKLFIIFIERTLVTLPIIAIIAHFIF